MIHVGVMDRLVLLACFLLALVLWWWTAGRGSRRSRRTQKLAQRAESRAEGLLIRAGYRIEARQVIGTWPMQIDGDRVDAGLRVDLLVRRGRRRYVAEVKSGPVGSRPTDPNTRRQLLEYRLAFRVDGVLLVDMHRRRIVEVEFPALDL